VANRRISMELIADPESGAVIRSSTTPAVRGAGSIDHACGGCGALIAESMKDGEIAGVAFRCPACGRANRAR